MDHKNNDFVLWFVNLTHAPPPPHPDVDRYRESDAILLYLAEKYDTTHAFSASSEQGKLEQLQWLFFQASGQGPYFGQATWFLWYHPEKVPSALERYRDEIKRVYGVLEGRLRSTWSAGSCRSSTLRSSSECPVLLSWNVRERLMLGL